MIILSRFCADFVPSEAQGQKDFFNELHARNIRVKKKFQILVSNILCQSVLFGEHSFETNLKQMVHSKLYNPNGNGC